MKLVIAATWVTRIEPAAIARMPSKSGKRGLPGGGATASGAAWLLTVRAAYAGRRRRLARVAPAVGFRGRLAIVALAALAIRTAATIYHRDYPVIGDALTFHLEGGHLAHGEGFRRVFEDVPTAEHPPLFIGLIALFTLLGADGFLAQKLLLGLVGTVTVVLVGLLARRVAGERAGLVAAGAGRRLSAAVAGRRIAHERVALRRRSSSPCCWRPTPTSTRAPCGGWRCSARSSPWRR